ncbi:MAG: hypothetical protein AAGD25_06845 [Cyanobacteria bacterium P01_F01_bin.150]
MTQPTVRDGLRYLLQLREARTSSSFENGQLVQEIVSQQGTLKIPSVTVSRGKRSG